MKKLFTMVAMAFMAVCVNAQTTLVSYPTQGDISGWKVSGTTTESTVKIHTNKDQVNALKLANGYTTDNVSNGNHIELTCEGGFKTGDVITIAGAVSVAEADVATKRATAVIFEMDADGKCTPLKQFSDFINGKLSEDNPVEESYTLEKDFDKLYIGRDGKTGAFVTKILVTRGSAGTAIESVKASVENNGKTYNVGGRVASKGLVIKNGKKYVK